MAWIKTIIQTHKKRGVRVYIINWRVTVHKFDDISHISYFLIYAATAVVILYWNPDQPFAIHRVHHDLFDEYNYCLYIAS